MSTAADATVPSVVADLFYFHERGHCMMILHTAISAGMFLGPLIMSTSYSMQGGGRCVNLWLLPLVLPFRW
jgi:hypothetical protein